MAPAEEEGSEVIVNSYKGVRARRLSYLPSVQGTPLKQ